MRAPTGFTPPALQALDLSLKTVHAALLVTQQSEHLQHAVPQPKDRLFRLTTQKRNFIYHRNIGCHIDGLSH